jgi:hypothetical protein
MVCGRRARVVCTGKASPFVGGHPRARHLGSPFLARLPPNSRMFVLLPLLEALLVLIIARPDRSDRLILAGFLWGLVACAGYDAFRLPTIYFFHLWMDFFGAVGAWAVGYHSNFVVGYLWRYVGDGGGISVAFFAVAATLGAGARPRRRLFSFAIAYAVCPVLAGLVLTDLIAPKGQALFPISPATLTCSLVGHLIYGTIFGVG